jgi:hypothetical protein
MDLTESQHRTREQDLEGHLTQGDAEPQSGADEESPQVPEAAESDLQLDRALEILKSWSYFERLKRDREAGFLQARASETTP